MGHGRSEADWVQETRFGRWFLGTEVWRRYVLGESLNTLVGLLRGHAGTGMRILDLGCGQGLALPLLADIFAPRLLIGVDIDRALIDKARGVVPGLRYPAEVLHGSALDLPLPDNAVDLVLCHQVLHHVARQAEVLAECRRVLAPGGQLLVAESCRCFIESSPVRLLFRHPRQVQKTAGQYLTLVRQAGFTVSEQDLITAAPWWSQGDLGLRERWGWARGQSLEPTEVLMLAWKG
ncbi:MAG: class I SAM-dependent methyltransferase [Chromatiaceae bacterium]|nr:class I SAM-dependent methyltransferase [Chromatiaceae bacterium]